jgi:3'5'-cyclic nucleotide phosphodiesterase
LENHHLSTTFKILKKVECNLFTSWKDKDYQMFRKLMINNILATDMKEHFNFMNIFDIKLNKQNYDLNTFCNFIKEKEFLN